MGILYRIRIHDTLPQSVIFFVPLLFVGLSSLLNPFYLSLYFTILIMNTVVFLINDYYDRDDDFHDVKKRSRNYFCSKKTFYKAKKIMLISIIFTLALTLISILHLIIVFSFYLFIILYSHPSFKLKAKPVIDILIHNCGALIMFIPGWIYLMPVNLSFVVMCVLVFMFSTGAELGQEIRDYNIDLKTNLKTTAIILGEKRAQLIRNILVKFSLTTWIFLVILNNIPKLL